jgi:hypothetical protein
MIKPGYRTSEFWFTLVSFIFSGAYLFGVLDDFNHKEDLIQETSKGVEAVILIIGQLTLLFRYVKGRTDLKKTWWDTATPEERKTAVRRNSTKSKAKKKIKKPIQPKVE